MSSPKSPGRFNCPACTRSQPSTWQGVLRRHYHGGAVCSGSGVVVIPDLASPTPARDFGSGAVDEMDPSRLPHGSVPGAPRLNIPRTAGEHS